MIDKNKKEIIRFGKFLIVGVINTSLTYIVYVCLRLFNLHPFLCNIVGYIVGFVNSFIWNKKWVFQTLGTNVKREFILFLLVFVFCYGIQLYIFHFMFNELNINEYVTQLISMGAYTVLNFILNRVISFQKSSYFRS